MKWMKNFAPGITVTMVTMQLRLFFFFYWPKLTADVNDEVLMISRIIVWSVFQTQSDKNGWSMETFMKHLKNRYGQRMADAAVEHMDECIVRLFLLLEPSLVTFFESRGTKQPSFR